MGSMDSVTEQLKSDEVIRKIWGKYLHDERRFDKWGGQGKILAIVEVMREEGIDTESNSLAGIDYQEIANGLFPRTFYCEQPRSINRSNEKAIARYFENLEETLSESGLTGIALDSTCAEETAEKFCISTEDVRAIIQSTGNV